MVNMTKHSRNMIPRSQYCDLCGSKLLDGKHTDEWLTIYREDGKEKRPKLYRAWSSMRNRCLNKNAQKYHRYGARGITICDEWSDYAEFRRWALANGYGPDLSIDRIDNDGNYEPSNCEWVPLTQNKAKLTPKQVMDVLKSGKSSTVLGKRYGVDPSVISNIRTGRTRSDITGIGK